MMKGIFMNSLSNSERSKYCEVYFEDGCVLVLPQHEIYQFLVIEHENNPRQVNDVKYYYMGIPLAENIVRVQSVEMTEEEFLGYPEFQG